MVPATPNLFIISDREREERERKKRRKKGDREQIERMIKIDREKERAVLTQFLATRNGLGNPEVTANLYCNFAYLYREGCVIFSIYFR